MRACPAGRSSVSKLWPLVVVIVLVGCVPLALAKDPPTSPAIDAPKSESTANKNVADSETAEHAHDAVRLPGSAPTGETLLPNGWSLRASGKQVKLGDFPVNIALHPKLPMAAVLHAGYGEHE